MESTTENAGEMQIDETAPGEIFEVLPGSALSKNRHETGLATIGHDRQKLIRLYILVPIIFLTVTLLGGLRLASLDRAFIFIVPSLMCLIFGVLLIVLFARGGTITIDGWFSDEFPPLRNAANSMVLITLFAASVQVFNSVIPESGLPFWIVAFCFLWTLWNDLFANFDSRRLIRSVAALFGFAFVAKYMVLANLTAPAGESWLRSLIENPARETVTWLLSLPKYSSATGYVQFFVILLYFLGLILLPQSTRLRKA